MKDLLAIAASIVMLWAAAASAAGRSNVVVVTIMGAGLIKIEGHIFSDVPTLKAKLDGIRRRNAAADFQIVAPSGSTIETLLPAINLIAKAGGLANSKGGGPPKMGFLIEPRTGP